jgi:hypothetical protein
MPNFEKAGCEIIYPDSNYPSDSKDGGKSKLNCQIVFGRDRPSHLLSGYGKVAGQPCASIDIVAGRMSSLVKKQGIFRKKMTPVGRDTLVGNNFFTDASRIYISQKCDIDHYFGLPPGDFGRPKGEAGIGIKSDHVRIIGRDSIKLFAGGSRFKKAGFKGELNSNGDRLSEPKIEFLTNLVNEPEPLVLGDKLIEFFEELFRQLRGMQEGFMLHKVAFGKIEKAMALHYHTGVGAGSVTTFPDPVLGDACLDDIKNTLQQAQSTFERALNFEVLKANYLGLSDGSVSAKLRLKFNPYILSSNVFTT